MSDREQKQEQLKKLMEEHPEINDKLKELNAANQQKMLSNVIGVMKEYGMELTPEDFKAPQGEISDDELEAVAGCGGCGCSVAGGGGGDFLTCVCFVGGGGTVTNDKYMEHGGCVCIGGGAGATDWGDENPDDVINK